MRAGLWGFVAFVVGAVTACAGSSGSSSTSSMQPKKAPAVTLAQRLAAAGVDCHGQQLVGNVDCTFRGEKVTVSVGRFSANQAQRKQACEQGFINPGYVVATDQNTVTLSADQNATTQAIAKAMHLTVATYCPNR